MYLKIVRILFFLLLLYLGKNNVTAQVNFSGEILQKIEEQEDITDQEEFDLYYWSILETIRTGRSSQINLLERLSHLKERINSKETIDKYYIAAGVYYHLNTNLSSQEKINILKILLRDKDLEKRHQIFLKTIIAFAYMVNDEMQSCLHLLVEINSYVEAAKPSFVNLFIADYQNKLFALVLEKDDVLERQVEIFQESLSYDLETRVINLYSLLVRVSYLEDENLLRKYKGHIHEGIHLTECDDKYIYYHNMFQTFLAESCYRIGKVKEAMEIFDVVKKSNFIDPNFHWIYALFLLRTNDYGTALIYFNKYLNSDSSDRLKLLFQSRFSEVLFEVGMRDQAIELISKLKPLFSKTSQYMTFSKMVELEKKHYKDNKDWKNYVASVEIFDSVNVEVVRQDINDRWQSRNLSSEMALLKSENLIMEKNISIHRLALGFLATGSLLLIGMFLYNKNRYNLLEELDEKNGLIRVQNTHLKFLVNDIKESNIRLESELKSKLTIIANNIKLLNQLKSKLEDLERNPSNKKALGSEKLSHFIDIRENEKILKDIDFQFLKLHEQFTNELTQQYPELTSNNIKLCIYLKMNLSSKEIAVLQYKTIESVKVARSRLRKKLGLTDPQLSLSGFLNGINSNSNSVSYSRNK